MIHDLTHDKQRAPYHRSSSKKQDGLTLIEIMIVIAIIALFSSTFGVGIGALYKTNLRSASLNIISLCNYAYHRSITRNKTIRLAFDLDSHTVSIEESIRNTPILKKQTDDHKDKEDQSHRTPSNIVTPMFPIQINRSSYHSIRGSTGNPIRRFLPHRLPFNSNPKPFDKGNHNDENKIHPTIEIVQLIMEEKTIDHGKAYVYFFPGGYNQHAIIELKDTKNNYYTVEISPLTAAGRVYPHAYNPQSIKKEYFKEWIQ